MISVIIPHYNQPDHLDRCLQALAGQEAGGHAVEIIVVDNNSREMPTDVVARHPGVRLISETEAGPGPARNTGVAQSKGEILAFIDADCIAHPGWLAAIAHSLSEGAQILGGDVQIHHIDAENPTIWEAYESEFAYRMEHYIKQQGFTGTGNLACLREIYDRVGPFAGIGVAEDRDWGQRATALGLTIAWVPEMRADHPARTSFAELARKWDRHTAHDFEMFLARPLGRLKWAIRTGLMLISPLAVLPRVLGSNRIRGGVPGKLKAMLGLGRIRLYRTGLMLRLLFSKDAAGLSARWRA